MAIKRLLRSTEIADSPFRSLQDVERYLNTVKQNAMDEDQMLRNLERQFARKLESAAPTKFTIQRDPGSQVKTTNSPHINAMRFDRIEVPNLEALKENFKIVDELSDQVEHLNTLHSQVSVSFRGVQGVNETLKGILTMQANLKSKLDRALKFLEGIGTKYAPQPFKDVVEQVCTTLSEELTFTDYEVMGYATDEGGDLHFTTYIKLINLEDDNGEFYREFYIVFTAVLGSVSRDMTDIHGSRKYNANRNTVEMKYYITVMHHFQTPGKFGKGKAFSKAAEAMHHLGVMLAIENIDNSIGTLPHNLNPDRITKDKLQGTDLVGEIQVEPDSLIFVFLTKATEKEAQRATAMLYQQVKTMMQKQVPGAVVKFKLKRDVAQRRYVLKLTLSTPAKHNQLDVHGLDFLKEQFGLDDKKLRQVVNIING